MSEASNSGSANKGEKQEKGIREMRRDEGWGIIGEGKGERKKELKGREGEDILYVPRA